MHPFHIFGIANIFGGSLFSTMSESLVTSSLLRETSINKSANYGYHLDQADETYNIVTPYGYFVRLLFAG